MKITQTHVDSGVNYYHVSGDGADFNGTLSECKRYASIFKSKVLSRERRADAFKDAMVADSADHFDFGEFPQPDAALINEQNKYSS